MCRLSHHSEGFRFRLVHEGDEFQEVTKEIEILFLRLKEGTVLYETDESNIEGGTRQYKYRESV